MRRSTRTLLVLALIAAGLGLHGLGAGGTFYYKNVRAPLGAAVDAPYYRESILHVGLAHVLGLAGSITAFRLFVLSCYWVGLVYLATIVNRRLAATDAVLVLLVLLCHPSAMIAHAWTCHPDALTYLLTALLMFSRRPAAAGVLAAIGIFNNWAMWLVICAQTALLWLSFAEPRARARALAVGVGVVVGAASWKLVLWLSGVQIGAGRLALAASERPEVLARYWTDAGWPAVYSLHFAHSLWLPAVVVIVARARPRAAAGLVAAQCLALAATFFAQDTTRVFAFLGWGSLLYGLVYALEQVERRWLRWLVGLAVVITIAAPRIFAWKGEIHDTTGARAHLRALLF